MGIFKSKEEREIERTIETKKALNFVRKHIRDSEKHEVSYIGKAKRAKKIGDVHTLNFIKKAIRKTMSHRRLLEKQLLSLESAIQIRDQMKSHAGFAKAMNAVSKSIAEMFEIVDLAKTQKAFESALVKAESMEERMELFLDMTTESIFSSESEGEAGIEDEEIDRLIEEEMLKDESLGEDKRISEGMKEVENELEKILK